MKGGFIVELNGVCVFLLGLLVDVCLVCDFLNFEG